MPVVPMILLLLIQTNYLYMESDVYLSFRNFQADSKNTLNKGAKTKHICRRERPETTGESQGNEANTHPPSQSATPVAHHLSHLHPLPRPCKWRNHIPRCLPHGHPTPAESVLIHYIENALYVEKRLGLLFSLPFL